MASLESIDDDDDFGYDLSLEDEKLLASLADDRHAQTPVSGAPETRQLHDAASFSRSGPRHMAAIVAVGRTSRVAAFMQRAQPDAPDAAPAVTPAGHVQYPDRMFAPPNDFAQQDPD